MRRVYKLGTILQLVLQRGRSSAMRPILLTGQSLLERIEGSEGGPYILALWREIAWKPEGSPIKGFKLAATDIFQAEQQLVAELEREAQTIG